MGAGFRNLTGDIRVHTGIHGEIKIVLGGAGAPGHAPDLGSLPLHCNDPSA
jgi:hypothetical protein